MKRVFLFAVLCIAVFTPLVRGDDFRSYTGNYLVLDETAPTGWVPYYDANSVTNGTLLKNDGLSFKTNVIVSSNSGHRASIHKTIKPTNAASFTNGTLYFWFQPTSISHLTSITVRIGSNSSNYYEYINENPYGVGFIAGAQLVPFLLSNASFVIGKPNLGKITYVQIIVGYTSLQPNFAFTVNRIWLEKQPNAFNGKWVVPIFGAKPDGWALPFSNTSEGYGMSVTHNDHPTLGKHGRVYNKQLKSNNHPTFTSSADLRLVNVGWGTRLFFDFVDGFNFASVFISTKWNKVGIENVIAGVRYYKQVEFQVDPKRYYHISYAVDGNTVIVWVDGVRLLTYNIPLRQPGEVGVESYMGTTHVKDFVFTDQ